MGHIRHIRHRRVKLAVIGGIVLLGSLGMADATFAASLFSAEHGTALLMALGLTGLHRVGRTRPLRQALPANAETPLQLPTAST